MAVEFIMGMQYHMPLGFDEKGFHTPEWVSRDGRWHARPGNYGTMIVTDRRNGMRMHVIKGKMPEVQAFVDQQPSS